MSDDDYLNFEIFQIINFNNKNKNILTQNILKIIELYLDKDLILYDWFEKHLTLDLKYIKSPKPGKPMEDIKLIYYDGSGSSAGSNYNTVWYNENEKKYILVIEQDKESKKIEIYEKLTLVFNAIARNSSGGANLCRLLKNSIFNYCNNYIAQNEYIPLNETDPSYLNSLQYRYQPLSSKELFYKNFDIKNYLHTTKIFKIPRDDLYIYNYNIKELKYYIEYAK